MENAGITPHIIVEPVHIQSCVGLVYLALYFPHVTEFIDKIRLIERTDQRLCDEYINLHPIRFT